MSRSVDWIAFFTIGTNFSTRFAVSLPVVISISPRMNRVNASDGLRSSSFTYVVSLPV